MTVIQCWWDAPNLGRWVFADDKHTLDRVMLIKPKGLVAEPKRETKTRSNGIGVDSPHVTYSQMEGSLELAISHDGEDYLSVGERYAELQKAFPTWQSGRLTVADSQNQQWYVDCVPKPFPTPESSPWEPGLTVFQVEISLVADTGVWLSPVERYTTSGKHRVFNIGDVPVCPTVVWQGQNRQVTLPSGVKITLPTVSDVRFLSTDPGLGYVITDSDGRMDVVACAALRGRAVPGVTPPGKSTEWELSVGVSLNVQYMCENPWR